MVAVVVAEPLAARIDTVVNWYEPCCVRSLASERCEWELELLLLDGEEKLVLLSSTNVLEPT